MQHSFHFHPYLLPEEFHNQLGPDLGTSSPCMALITRSTTALNVIQPNKFRHNLKAAAVACESIILL